MTIIAILAAFVLVPTLTWWVLRRDPLFGIYLGLMAKKYELLPGLMITSPMMIYLLWVLSK